MRKQRARPDQNIARIAARQHGVVTFAQLLGVGLIPSTIHSRVRAGRLHRVFRSVYAVGHPGLSNEGRWLAAVLAVGDGAVLSHRSAAEHLGLLPIGRGPVHVTVAGDGGRRKRAGIIVHRSSSLTRGVVVVRDGIAMTNAERTLADLRRAEPPEIVAKAMREANFRGWGLGSDGEGGNGRRGHADWVAGREAGVRAGERSVFEKRFLRFCARRRLPGPEVNVQIGSFTVDFLWRSARLVVETDGWKAHRGRQAFEDDRARDLYLRSRGLEVLRFSWRQLNDDPATIAALLRRYLA